MFVYFEDNTNNNQCMKVIAWIQIKQQETIVCIFLQYKCFISVQKKSFNDRYFSDFWVIGFIVFHFLYFILFSLKFMFLSPEFIPLLWQKFYMGAIEKVQVWTSGIWLLQENEHYFVFSPQFPQNSACNTVTILTTLYHFCNCVLPVLSTAWWRCDIVPASSQKIYLGDMWWRYTHVEIVAVNHNDFCDSRKLTVAFCFISGSTIFCASFYSFIVPLFWMVFG
jgi:hypothetical protein